MLHIIFIVSHSVVSNSCDPIVCSLPGSSVHWILQARTLEWVAMPSSGGSFQCRDVTYLFYVSCVGSQILTTDTTWEALNIMYSELICFITGSLYHLTCSSISATQPKLWQSLSCLVSVTLVMFNSKFRRAHSICLSQ